MYFTQTLTTLPAAKVIPEISITVQDEDETGVASASVKLTDGTNTYEKTTGSAGGCTVQNAPEGTYTITVTATGYKDYEDEVSLTVESPDIEVTLEAEEEAEEEPEVEDGG